VKSEQLIMPIDQPWTSLGSHNPQPA
jgi:hypothetical protein